MKLLRRLVVAGVAIFALLQAVPYGWEHPNPPVQAEAPWPNEEAKALADAACYSCHSNETHWPIYSYVAPMSWLVRNDVESGRHKLNFSEWGDGHDRHDAGETIADGSMPPRQYTLLHPDARLSAAEKRALIDALRQMHRSESGSGRRS